MQPHTLDGRTLIVLRQRATGFETVCSGRLSFDGEALSVADAHDRELMVLTDTQLLQIKHVVEGNRIPQCAGYDFFIVEPAD